MLHRKEREVAARSDRMTVSLVGYTNAGKSTLLNKLTGSDVLAEDKLFATLDTRTRRWQLPGWGPVLLSDTVGFIRDLPHSLIASFKATLEEARQADLLLHVADASNPAALDQIAAVYKVLEELGIREKDTILVLNQIDAVHEPGTLEMLRTHYSSAIPVSARTGEGLSRLAAAVSDALDASFPGRRHRNRRGQRPAAGLPGEARRNSQPHLFRRSGFGPLPDAAQEPGPDFAPGCARETPRHERPCRTKRQRPRDRHWRANRRRGISSNDCLDSSAVPRTRFGAGLARDFTDEYEHPLPKQSRVDPRAAHCRVAERRPSSLGEYAHGFDVRAATRSSQHG